MAVALPLIIHEDWQHITYIRDAHQRSSMLRPIVLQESVEWNSENIDYWVTKPEAVVRYTNLPAAIIAGWHFPPHSRFTLAGIADNSFGRLSVLGTVATSISMVLLVFIQWLFVAGRPLVTPRRVWLEPSVLILTCGVASFALILFPFTREGYFIPLLVAVLTWFVWAVLLLVRGVVLGWRSVLTHSRRHGS